MGIDGKRGVARRGTGGDDDQVRPVGVDQVDARLDAGSYGHVELRQRRDPVGPHTRNVFLVWRCERKVHLAAGLILMLPHLDLPAVGREYARGFEAGDTPADDEHAGILLSDSFKPRLEPGERLKLGADKRVLDTGDIELERQPLKADVARDARADWPLHFAEGLETPVR